MQRHTQLDGIVIRRANIGETDRIITLLTPEGKLAVVARGVRKMTSQKMGRLELFHVVRLNLSQTQHLPIVQEVSILETFPRLREEFDKVTQAFWAAELIDRLVEDGAGGSLYPKFRTFLGRLEQDTHHLDVRTFELTVLEDLGWLPELTRCVQCHKELEPIGLGWSNRHGGILDKQCVAREGCDRPISPAVVKALRMLASYQWDMSGRLVVSREVAQELQEILHHYLESINERSFRTPGLLQSGELHHAI